MLDKNIGRRRFIKTLAVLGGITVAADVLVACGDTATTIAAPTAPAGTGPTTLPTVTSNSLPTVTAAPSTVAATTATTSVATTSSATTATAVASSTTAPAVSKNNQAPKGYEMLGTVSTYKAGGDPVTFTVKSTNGYVYNSNGNFFVFNDICTHQGCEVPYVAADGKFECPCHGSQYDKTGEVIQGPARKRLKKYQTKVVNNSLYAKIG